MPTPMFLIRHCDNENFGLKLSIYRNDKRLLANKFHLLLAMELDCEVCLCRVFYILISGYVNEPSSSENLVSGVITMGSGGAFPSLIARSKTNKMTSRKAQSPSPPPRGGNFFISHF